MVQQLRLHAPTAEGPVPILVQGRKIPHAKQKGKKKKNQKQQSLLFLSCYSYKSRRMQEVAKGINKLSREIKISWDKTVLRDNN